MHLLYLDESGTHSSADHLVVGGLAVGEEGASRLQRELDGVVRSFFPDTHAQVVLHAASLRVGANEVARPPYNELSAKQRRKMLRDSFEVIADSAESMLFATVVNKAGIAPHDAYEVAFEDLVSRFDRMISRLHGRSSTGHGLVIVAESNYRERLQTLGDRILRDGARWGELRNIVDVPLFAAAPRIRLLQAADLVVNAVYGQYEKRLGRDFEALLPKFDREGNRLHGLTHLGIRPSECWCIACYSWRTHRRGGIAEEPATWVLEDVR